VKPRLVELRDARTPRDVIRKILQLRLEESLSLAGELETREPEGLHDFRIACKRLRYAMERFAALDPSYEETASRLADLQDALGEAHDRDVLLTILPPAMELTQRRLQQERESYVDRAASLWNQLNQPLTAMTA
jgi:CHAD domain-containing protein